jgi:hypothetical protein
MEAFPMHEDPTVMELRQRVRILEERLAGLRASRRVLMNLLAAQRDQQDAALRRMESETRRLKSRTSRFARDNWEKNRTIWELRARLGEQQHEA